MRHLNKKHPSRVHSSLILDKFKNPFQANPVEANPIDTLNRPTTARGSQNPFQYQATPASTPTNQSEQGTAQTRPSLNPPTDKGQPQASSSINPFKVPAPDAIPVNPLLNPEQREEKSVDPKDQFQRFPCTHCFAKFQKKINLLKHQQSVHALEIPMHGKFI